jgi:hypothetical protein
MAAAPPTPAEELAQFRSHWAELYGLALDRLKNCSDPKQFTPLLKQCQQILKERTALLTELVAKSSTPTAKSPAVARRRTAGSFDPRTSPLAKALGAWDDWSTPTLPPICPPSQPAPAAPTDPARPSAADPRPPGKIAPSG